MALCRPLQGLVRARPALLASPPTRLIPRHASSAATTTTNSEEDGQDQFYTHESFNTPFMRYTGAAIVGLIVLYKYSLSSAPGMVKEPGNENVPGSNQLIEEAEDVRRPWLTRFMAYHLAPRSELDRERTSASYDLILEAAENRLLFNTAQPAPLRRFSQWSFVDGSPFRHRVGRQPDFSDIKYRTYEDDRRMPELPKTDAGGDQE